MSPVLMETLEFFYVLFRREGKLAILSFFSEICYYHAWYLLGVSGVPSNISVLNKATAKIAYIFKKKIVCPAYLFCKYWHAVGTWFITGQTLLLSNL